MKPMVRSIHVKAQLYGCILGRITNSPNCLGYVTTRVDCKVINRCFTECSSTTYSLDESRNYIMGNIYHPDIDYTTANGKVIINR